jgi:putative membrane protein
MVTGLAVLVASKVISGIHIDSVASGIVAVVVLAILNALVRPILYLLSAPFIVVTLGLFMLVINGFLLGVVSYLVEGFQVDGFWPAVGGAVIISLVSGFMNLFIAERGQVEVAMSHSRGRKIRHIN